MNTNLTNDQEVQEEHNEKRALPAGDNIKVYLTTMVYVQYLLLSNNLGCLDSLVPDKMYIYNWNICCTTVIM